MRTLCSAHARRGPDYGVGLGFYAFLRFHVDTTKYRRWNMDPAVASLCPPIVRPPVIAQAVPPAVQPDSQPTVAPATTSPPVSPIIAPSPAPPPDASTVPPPIDPLAPQQ